MGSGISWQPGLDVTAEYPRPSQKTRKAGAPVRARPLIQQAGPFYMLGFGIFDMMLVGGVILLVC
ncbi:MAG: hypothetical protein WBM11_16515 [Terriglobales bacterium]